MTTMPNGNPIVPNGFHGQATIVEPNISTLKSLSNSNSSQSITSNSASPSRSNAKLVILAPSISPPAPPPHRSTPNATYNALNFYQPYHPSPQLQHHQQHIPPQQQYQQQQQQQSPYGYQSAIDPRYQQQQLQQQQQQPYYVADDEDYFPESSLQAADQTLEKRQKRKNSPTDSEFPPVTVENINKLREESENSKDVKKRFFFVSYLLDTLRFLVPTSQDPVRYHQLQAKISAEAISILKKELVPQKFADALFLLASCYGTGLYGVKEDLEKAFNLYLQGAKINHPECTYRVAVCYERGLGAHKDIKYALTYYKKAASLSDPSAMYKLGLVLLHGFLNQAANPKEGMSWLERAGKLADVKHPHALHELGLAYEKKDNPIPSVIPDLNYALELYTDAAQLDYAPSQYKLGSAYENGELGCPIDPRRSIAWYSRAAEQDHVNSQLALSGWYLTGADGILNQNDEQAYLWARQAAEKGLAKAEYAVGYYIETGIGIAPNLEEARRWYQKAAKQGDKKAAQRLDALRQSQMAVGLKRRPTRDKNNKLSSKDSDCKLM